MPDDCKIDIWRDPDAHQAPNAASASRWASHCEQTFRRKQIEFDCLSIDVFFSKDDTDPLKSYAKQKGVELCTGLYHGLVALARRRAEDSSGNMLPLAWEVRTASPKLPLTSSQEAEIVRIYGLLLALAQPYRDDRGFLGLEPGGPTETPTGKLVLDAFRAQDRRVGAGLDMAGSLLPQWRERLIEAIREKSVTVDVRKTRQLLVDFEQIASKDGASFGGERLALPLMGRHGRTGDEIWLSSIFYDFMGSEREDLDLEVNSWLKRVIGAARNELMEYVEPVCRWIEYVRSHLRGTELTTEDYKVRWGEWENSTYVQRCLAIVCYYVAATIDRRAYPFPRGQAHFCAGLGRGHSVQILRQPFIQSREAGHVGIGSMKEFKTHILDRLSLGEIDLPFSDSFRDAVAEVLHECNLLEASLGTAPCLATYIQERA